MNFKQLKKHAHAVLFYNKNMNKVHRGFKKITYISLTTQEPYKLYTLSCNSTWHALVAWKIEIILASYQI